MSKNRTQNQLIEAVDVAPLEAYAPQAMALQGDDFIIRLCDGDYEHVYLATRKKTAKQYTVVEVYPGGGVEVEFVRGSGVTQALLTLSERDIRKMDAHDLLTTRRLAKGL